MGPLRAGLGADELDLWERNRLGSLSQHPHAGKHNQLQQGFGQIEGDKEDRYIRPKEDIS